jgi:MFS family permease
MDPFRPRRRTRIRAALSAAVLSVLGSAAGFSAPGGAAAGRLLQLQRGRSALSRGDALSCARPLLRARDGLAAQTPSMPGRGSSAPVGTRPRAAVRSARRATALRASAGGEEERKKEEKEDDYSLPPAVLPICLGVFVQMLGEGIAISSIPLHLKSFGATAVQVGLATSAFSIAQMVCCPFIVKLSSKIGRTTVLRVCLAGATFAAFVITLSPTINGVIFGRFLGGIFAASVPVAQAGVTDLVPSNKSALALSRVASANQMGIVVGPAMSAMLAYVFGLCGLAAHLQMRAVFFCSGLFAATVLLIDKLQAPLTPASVEKDEAANKDKDSARQGTATSFRRETPGVLIQPHPYAQPILRSIALVIGWSLTLSVSTYCLFGNAIMGWQQPQVQDLGFKGNGLRV